MKPLLFVRCIFKHENHVTECVSENDSQIASVFEQGKNA